MDAQNQYPASQREAEDHIRQIRRDKGLGDNPNQIGHNAADLEAALQVLSTDLYQTATHFLLELIQNADDNQYVVDVPTLRISYSPGRIRIDCNERGFSRRNVEAICRICQSTKSGRSKAAGFVGEKGIGFKAVFKVASVVHLTSGHYSFKFDRNGHLGMIAPIWSAFPEAAYPQWTSILLDLDSDCDEPAIARELRLYDSRILMFLRRLRRIEIDVKKGRTIGGALKSLTRRDKEDQPPPEFRNVLSRGDQDLSSNPARVRLEQNGQTKQYMVWRHEARRLPKEARRPGISSSEIVLAFPLQSDGQSPEITTQSVYAFLPIREYGFNFLLQADFLLSSTREDIQIDSAWNKALASAAADAFQDAVVSLSSLPETNRLRYDWLKYVPVTSTYNVLMNEIATNICSKLKFSLVMHTRQPGGQRQSPVGLKIVPDDFCDEKGVPFFQTEKNGFELLSREYTLPQRQAAQLSTILEALGIEVMDGKTFFEKMGKLLENDPKAFYSTKSAKWHSGFCSTLYSLALASEKESKNPTTLDPYAPPLSNPTAFYPHLKLRKLPVVPLRGGDWVGFQPGDSQVYISERTAADDEDLKQRPVHLPIPEGIPIRVITNEAAADPDRRRLFEYLGVETLSEKGIRQAIFHAHLYETFKPGSLAPRVLASHLVALFWSGFDEAGRPPAVGREGYNNVRLLSEKGKCLRAEYMYMRSNRPNSAYKLLPEPGSDSNYGFLHPIYFDMVEDQYSKKWLDFLRLNVKIPVHPRLHRFAGGLMDSALHPDFKSLLNAGPDLKPSVNWLNLIREGWQFYQEPLATAPSVSSDERFQGRKIELIEALRNAHVPCKGSTLTAPLMRAYMPVPSLMKEFSGLVSYLDIDDPEDPTWAPVMEALRIPHEPKLIFYIDCLRSCKKNPKTTFDTILRLLKRIEETAPESPATLAAEFATESLICIPAKARGGTRQWVKASDCVWRGESWMNRFCVLSRIYPERSLLFSSSLRIQDADLYHIIQEASHLPAVSNETRSPKLAQKICLSLTTHLISRGTSALPLSQKGPLLHAKVFPIVSNSENAPYECLASANDKESWLIADRAIFRTQFRGVLPVLAFDADVVLKIRPLLEVLDLQDRILSRVATNVTEAHGNVTLLEGVTGDFQERSEFLFRLMPFNQPNQEQLRTKFRNVDVFSADSIVQYWRAPLGLQQVQSAQASGTAFLESDYCGDLRVYMPSGYENESHPFELAEQIRQFFSIPVEHRDLVLLALTAKLDRVDAVFSLRGIGPLLENGANGDNDELSEDEDQNTGSNDVARGSGESASAAGNSRFARLLDRKRFNPSFFDNNENPDSLPSYSAAVARSTTDGSGNRLYTRQVPNIFTLPSLKRAAREMEFHQSDGKIVAQPSRPLSFVDRVKGLAQRDVDIGEAIVSDALGVILGPQYMAEDIWNPRGKRKSGHSSFIFADSQGRFSSFLMRLEGRTGKAQGYTNMIYHLDVKATEKQQAGSFQLSQAELDRARRFSTHSDSDSASNPNKHVSVLVHISDVRDSPKILFLVDPWDLYKDGQLSLHTASSYQATLRLKPQQDGKSNRDDGGFDTVQIRQHSSHGPAGAPPAYEKRDDDKPSTPEMREVPRSSG